MKKEFYVDFRKENPMLEVEITNKQLAWIEPNKSMCFECPECKYTQIEKNMELYS